MGCIIPPQLVEEAGVHALDATHRGILTFHFDDNPQPWEVRSSLSAAITTPLSSGQFSKACTLRFTSTAAERHPNRSSRGGPLPARAGRLVPWH